MRDGSGMAVFESLGSGLRVVVAGASGGIGSALVRRLAGAANVARVDALSRSGRVPAGVGVVPGALDIEDEVGLARAAERLGEGAPWDALLVATGVLHGPGLAPEKDWRALGGEGLARAFRVNATGPALLLGRLLEGLPRDGRRRVVGVLSARVGSISDNRAGGWYGYRASKAALNQILRTAAVEAAQRRPGVVIAGLQPGTVRTALSDPFRSGPTERNALEPDEAAAHLLAVLDRLQAEQSGRMFDWRGEEVPP